MKALSRREFVRLSAMGFGAAVGGCTALKEENVLPAWREGELEIHFVYTGCGENVFLRFPDGTSVLNDTGEFCRRRSLGDVPLLPSSDRLGGDWMARYVKRIHTGNVIDYAVFSHWHSDHIGHARWDLDGRKDGEPDGLFRWRTTADGRKIDGFLCVAEEFRFRRYLDHQYPARGTYRSHDSSLDLLTPWVEAERRRGLVVEPFRVGALDQIRLLHDPERYKGVFSVRNLFANGVMWDGGDGTVDYAAEHVAATGNPEIPQNQLSLGYVVQYGKFRYYSGGDIEMTLRRRDGTVFDLEGEAGRLAGPVSVCKMNHHGVDDAMSESFVRAVRAQVYVSCIWSPGQVNETTIGRMSSTALHGRGDMLILPNLVPDRFVREHANDGFMKNMPCRGANHVVVKVLPGGGRFRVYLIDPHDECMRVTRCWQRMA